MPVESSFLHGWQPVTFKAGPVPGKMQSGVGSARDDSGEVTGAIMNHNGMNQPLRRINDPGVPLPLVRPF